MSQLKKFTYHTALYTTLITLVFYIFALVLGLPEQSIGIGRFLVLLSFSMIISVAEYIFDIKSLKLTVKYLVHYSSLFLVFFFVFLSVRFEGGSSLSLPFVFTCWFIFTVSYILVALILNAVKKRFSKQNKT